MREFGIDISKWQGNFDFDKAVAEGVKFVIVKGGGGDDGLYRDPKFETNYAEVKKRNLPTGCYWFSKAVSVDDAIKEADYFYEKCLKDHQFELPVYMDVEHRSQLALGKAKLTEIVKAFCERLEAKGYWVGIYASLNTFRSYLNDAELQNYAHWVAQWTTKLTYTGNDGVCGMWQFGGEENNIRTNKVAGVTCDQNYMLIDYPAMIKAAGLNGFAKKQTATETKPITPSKPTENTAKIGVGDLVSIAKNAVYYNGWIIPSWVKQHHWYVDSIKGDRAVLGKNQSGYNNINSPVNTKYLTVVQKGKTEPVAETPKTDDSALKVGDKVKMSSDAVQYGKKAKFASFVYNATLYVREMNGNRIVVSTQKTGAVTGAVHKKYLTKI